MQIVIAVSVSSGAADAVPTMHLLDYRLKGQMRHTWIILRNDLEGVEVESPVVYSRTHIFLLC